MWTYLFDLKGNIYDVSRDLVSPNFAAQNLANF